MHTFQASARKMSVDADVCKEDPTLPVHAQGVKMLRTRLGHLEIVHGHFQASGSSTWDLLGQVSN